MVVVVGLFLDDDGVPVQEVWAPLVVMAHGDTSYDDLGVERSQKTDSGRERVPVQHSASVGKRDAPAVLVRREQVARSGPVGREKMPFEIPDDDGWRRCAASGGLTTGGNRGGAAPASVGTSSKQADPR